MCLAKAYLNRREEGDLLIEEVTKITRKGESLIVRDLMGKSKEVKNGFIRENDEGEFIIEVEPAYEAGLNRLEEFRYVYVLYYLHQRRGPISLKVKSPWSEEEVGLFASRSSHRPNPIGLSVVKIIKRQENKLFTSGLDVFDGTSLLDLKPYLQELDAKADADYGWLNGSESRDHLLLHIKGIPH